MWFRESGEWRKGENEVLDEGNCGVSYFGYVGSWSRNAGLGCEVVVRDFRVEVAKTISIYIHISDPDFPFLCINLEQFKNRGR